MRVRTLCTVLSGCLVVVQTQFEIEINSSQPSEEVVEVEGGEELKSHDIAGPSFTVIQDTQVQ